MSGVIVNELALISKKVEYMPPINTRTTVYTFLVTDVVSSNTKYSIAVAMGCRLGVEASDVKDIGAKAENFILNTMKSDFKNKKKLVVIELTNYPYITAYVDYRDQAEMYENDFDEFSQDILRTWNSQTNNYIPVIIVNVADIRDAHTGLKFLAI